MRIKNLFTKYQVLLKNVRKVSFSALYHRVTSIKKYSLRINNCYLELMDELAGKVADRCGTFMYGFRDDLVDSLLWGKINTFH